MDKSHPHIKEGSFCDNMIWGDSFPMIGLTSDHAGFNHKESIKAFLDSQQLIYTDYGTFSNASVDYPDYGHLLASSMEQGKIDIGIAVCGTGNGLGMTLNKHTGIRAAVCWNIEITELVRKHNDANILVLPGRFITPTEAVNFVKIFLSTSFEGGRHLLRIIKIPI